MRLRVFFYGCCALLGGCANTLTPAEYQQSLAQQAYCLEKQQLKPHPVNYDKAASFTLGVEHKEVIEENGKRSYAILNLLPEYGGPYSIEIMSHAQKGGVLPPKIELMDDNRNVTRIFDSGSFRFNRAAFKATIFINEANQKEKFMLISADPNYQDAPQKIIGVQVSAVSVKPGVTLSFASEDKHEQIANSCGGQITVKLSRYQPQSIDQLNK